MSVDEWGTSQWLLLALSTVVAIALPLVMRLKPATPTALRERVLFSRPHAVVLHTTAICVGAGVVGILFGLGVSRFPVLWGAVLVAVSAFYTSLWYAQLYRRMVSRLMDEIAAELEDDHSAPADGNGGKEPEHPAMYSLPWAWFRTCFIGIGSGAAAGVGAYLAGVHPGWSVALGVGALILSGGSCAFHLYDSRR